MVVVVDIGNHRLVLWRLGDGSVWKQLGSLGTNPGQLTYPQAVAVTSTGALVVTDQHRVQVLTVDRAVLCVLDPTTVAGVGRLGGFLCGVTVCADTDEILVTDAHNNRVVALTWSPPSQVLLVCFYFSNKSSSFFFFALNLSCVGYISRRPVLGAGRCRSVGWRAGLGQPGRGARATQRPVRCGDHVGGMRVDG